MSSGGNAGDEDISEAFVSPGGGGNAMLNISGKVADGEA